MGIIGIWLNHITIAPKIVLFDVYFIFPESRDAIKIIHWVKRHLNHRHVLRLFFITIRIRTDWLALCSFLMQCKYKRGDIRIFVLVAYHWLKIIFRNYTLYIMSLACPDMIFLGIWTLYMKARVVWWYTTMGKTIDLRKDGKKQ